MADNIGYLTLSTGDVLTGKWLYKTCPSQGEMVFNTAMTGYQEVMTDPSYADQIVTMTYPLIGNYGINDLDYESIKPYLSGLIISYPCPTPDHYESKYTLLDMVKKYEIPTLYDIDTRALTRIIRKSGEVYGKITTNKRDFPTMKQVDSNIVQKVSITEPYTWKPSKPTYKKLSVVVMDFGFKHSISKTLHDMGCEVTIVPFNTSFQQINSLHPDAVVLSNGPGNPKDLKGLFPTLKQITNHYPTLGICLGHQLIALAHGGETKRLPYGHRGSNHPVKDLITGKVFITSQNHGYVVESESLHAQEWKVSHINVNDQSVEGMVHHSKPIMAVQFHPEAHPGPMDSFYIFSQFMKLISTTKGEKQHA
ncbi:carbamoyl phosphate synthase small subunit [Salinibacillus xinjiangensis]|uniref:Carbamoyl phosphate synthase small chain n=1 Tax=Salinibacillus xinjiangensis TaxID=1229268 RepID=A0A6G1XBE9_9BACI|nr:carbamoyl phosphate synthase small subunit [Salinibacillus xinjiangensis]MRG88267.1 carbamoyl phosphate synthase small subunit [Salinibacillus xinjiangensis]